MPSGEKETKEGVVSFILSNAVPSTVVVGGCSGHGRQCRSRCTTPINMALFDTVLDTGKCTVYTYSCQPW